MAKNALQACADLSCALMKSSSSPLDQLMNRTGLQMIASERMRPNKQSFPNKVTRLESERTHLLCAPRYVLGNHPNAFRVLTGGNEQGWW